MATDPLRTKLISNLTDFATVVAILGAIVYWIGWFFSIQYFSSFGVGWYVDTLDTAALLRNSYVVSAAFVFSTLLFSVAFSWSKRLYGWLCLAAFLCLIFSGTVPLVPAVSGRLLPGVVSFVAGIGMLGFAASIIAARARPPFTNLKNYLEPLYLICVVLLIAAPAEFAHGFAALHSQAGDSSALPKVILKDENSEWRLLAVNGENCLLVRIGTEQAPSQYRYLPLEDLSSIGRGIVL